MPDTEPPDQLNTSAPGETDAASASTTADTHTTPTEPVTVASPTHRRWLPPLLEIVLLGAIVTLALVLRFRGITWASGYYLHPDELHLSSVLDRISLPGSIREYLDTQTSPLNPFNHDTGYVYGTFPLFVAEWLGSFTDYTAIHNNHIPGRWLSALADTGSVVFAWWIGRMLWNRWVGLLAALLLACTVLNIQSAHYFTTDSWSTMFATGAFAFVLAAWKHQRWVLYALAGLMVGLAGASKPTMLAAIGFLALPAFETIRLSGWQTFLPKLPHPVDEETARQPRVENPFPVFFASILAVLVAVWTFRLAQPYTFAGLSLLSFQLDARWLDDIRFWQLVQAGEIDYPPSHQWTERAPLVFQLRNLVLWGMGPALGVTALAGLAWIGWRIVSARQWPSWVWLMPAGWIVFHLLYFGLGLITTMRYLLPAYPLLVVFAAGLLVALVRWGWRRGSIAVPIVMWRIRPPGWCHPGLVLPVLVVAATLFYAVAFVSIYTNPHTRVVASEWIVENIPDDSTIVSEYWDSGLPVGIPEQAGRSWVGIYIAPYDDEQPDKVNRMVGVLQRADYVILSSNRLIDSIERLPWRYPLANAYYHALLSGELGFEEVAHFTSFPELFGLAIDDRGAEEAFTVYDHPEVRIFRKTDAWNAHDAWYLLNDALGHGGISIRPVQTQPNRMMLDIAGQDAVRGATSWTTVFDPGSITNRFAPVAWYLGLQLMSLIFVPLAWRLFPWLPDRGYALTKTLGPFLIAWLAWWLSASGLMGNGLLAIGLGWLLVAGGSVLAVRRDPAALVSDLRQRRPWWLATELILLVGYMAALLVRAGNPDLWLPGRAGIQLQNMGAFIAHVLTPSFPAYDPWLLDGILHDFTFGLLPWAMLTRASGIVPEIAYSLTLATLAALVLLNAWSLTSLLVQRFRPRGRVGYAIGSGLLGIVTIGLLGPWGIAQRIAADDWSPNYEGSIPDIVRGIWQALTTSPDLPAGAWWSVTSWAGMAPLEVPLVSFLTNELAMQQLGLPLLIGGLTLAIGFLTRPLADVMPDGFSLSTLGGWRPTIAWLAALGIVTGWLVATNPLFGFALFSLTALVAVLVAAAIATWQQTWIVMRDWLLCLLALGTIAAIAIWPFFRMYGTFATRREVLPQPLSLPDFASLMGAGLVVVIGWLLVAGYDLVDTELRAHGLPRWLSPVPMLLLAAALVLAWLVGLVVLFLALVLLVVGFLVWHQQRSPRHLALLGLVTVAFGVALVAHLFRFSTWPEPQNIPRQFLVVAFVFLAIVTAVVIAVALDFLRRSRWSLSAMVVVLAAVTVMAPGLIYPLLAVPTQQQDRLVAQPPTLDATGFMFDGQLTTNAAGMAVEPYDLAPDLAAITWLRNAIDGLPAILEVPASQPGWGGRVSALTGFPTVVGAVDVQTSQRPGMGRLITWRLDDVNAVYASTDDFAAIEPILRDYGVQLIYVGALERASYPASGLAKFDAAVAAGQLESIYAADGVSIYRYSGIRESREPGS